MTYVAWLLIALGALALAVSLRRIRSHVSPSQTRNPAATRAANSVGPTASAPSPSPAAHSSAAAPPDASPLEPISRPSDRGAPGATSQDQEASIPEARAEVAGDLLPGGPSGSRRTPGGAARPRRIPRGRGVYRMEQERWSLPGFLSAPQAEAMRLDARELELDGALTGAPRPALFQPEHYRLANQGDFPDSAGDLERFARACLAHAADALGPCDATLYLKDASGRCQPALRRSGSIFISGDELLPGRDAPDDELIERLEDGSYVSLEDGREVWFPLPSPAGMLGALRFAAERPLYNADRLAAAWFAIRRFGAALRQARIFELAVSDPESTLGAGFQFQRDLAHEIGLRRALAGKRQLYLLEFSGPEAPEQMEALGLILRRSFARDMRLYRIAGDAFALLGPRLQAEEINERFGSWLAAVRGEAGLELDLWLGCAALATELDQPQEWFDRAALALQEAREEGANSFRIYADAQAGPFVGEAAPAARMSSSS